MVYFDILEHMPQKTTKEWEQYLGKQVRSLRLRKNLTQSELAQRSGISTPTLIRLEQGKGSSLETLVSVLNVLGEDAWLQNLAPKVSISPLQMVQQKRQRQRASSPSTISTSKS
jgi:transcriptional regulator with XRE-family HTH domain